MEGFAEDLKPRQNYTFSVSPDFEVEAQSHLSMMTADFT